MGCGGVGWDVNVHVTLIMLRWSWGGVGWDVNVHVTLTMLRWSWGGVGWDATVHVTLISGTQTIDSDWKSLKCWLPKEASKKRGTVDLVTHSSKWSKGSGNGCGAEPNCAAIIQRNLQPWANCSMVEVVFRTSKNRRATLHRQFQLEIHAHALRTTRRLSAPFPS